MKKDLGLILGLFLVVLVLLVFGGGYTSTVFLDQNKEASKQAATSTFVTVTSGSLNIQAEVANSPDLKKKGLSDRDSLALDKGMIFIFDSAANHTFWMKNMKFAIDIIWIDENKKIVYIVENASPEPDNNDDELTRYSATSPAKYVLEINAGLSKLSNLKIGESVDFSL